MNDCTFCIWGSSALFARKRSNFVIFTLSMVVLSTTMYYFANWFQKQYTWIKTPFVRSELPSAILVGAKKAGTGAIRTYLRKHPDISFNMRELKFFDNPEEYKKGYRYYISLFEPRKNRQQIRIEKSPTYFYIPEVTERLWQMNANLKILITVRDPIRRIISEYSQHKAYGLTNKSFAQTLLKRSGKVKSTSNTLSSSLYAKHFKRFLQYFPRENIHVVDGDALITDNPYYEFSKLESFLGVRSFFKESSFVFVEEKGFYCFSDNGDQSCLGDSKGREQAFVSDKACQVLKEYLFPLNEHFFQLLGRRFSWND